MDFSYIRSIRLKIAAMQNVSIPKFSPLKSRFIHKTAPKVSIARHSSDDEEVNFIAESIPYEVRGTSISSKREMSENSRFNLLRPSRILALQELNESLRKK